MKDTSAHCILVKLSPFSVTLETSDVVLIREIGPEDRELLQSGFAHLSEQSRTFRFLAAHPRLSIKELVQFTALNDADHFAIGALIETEKATIPVGTARYIRSKKDRKLAELATTIVDEYHGLGLGSLMLGVLAKHAVFNGVTEFIALVHEENARMLGLLEELDAVAATPGAPEIEFRVPLYRDVSRYLRTPAGDAFRRAYRLAQFA